MPSPAPATFDHVPTLRELLPHTAGWPGFIYAQVAYGNVPKAITETAPNGYQWEKARIPQGESYTITGPLGPISMALVCAGEPVPNMTPDDGVCECLVDYDEVCKVTGLKEEIKPSTPTPPNIKPPTQPQAST